MADEKWFTALSLAETFLLASTGLLLAVIAWRLWNWCDAWLSERRRRQQTGGHPATQLPMDHAAMLPLLAASQTSDEELEGFDHGNARADTGILRRCRLEATEETRLLNAYAEVAETTEASRRGYRSMFSEEPGRRGLEKVLSSCASQQPLPVSPTARCSLFSEAIFMEQAMVPDRHAVTAFSEDPP
ncbi:hypothetical protein BOX15_Mlig025551g6 [Macrostomum lignano]|uniref:Uncharacterized protein n=1 Tax=Macrostomum lignano TaxID=282301 RepID=A0A267EPN6_9PLAT|nr:hypothetical protein BOX15_Mlig025551g6 [Macrostomum lignano]